jgi:LacI family transcriptional regulator
MTDGCSAVPRVQSDNAAIGQLAGQHLAALGCKSFAWAPFIDDVQNWERYKGFQKELRRRGFDCELLPTAHHKIGSVWYDDWSDWRHAVAEQLEKLPKPIGLFAFNDCLAGELAALALEVGLPVPDALSIIGVGNELVECESAPITLTSIDPDLPEMAYQAACLLDDMLAGKPVARDTFEVKPKGVVVRESAAAADNQENARIGQAIAFISQSFADPNLNVALVADSLGISRRQLERDFRADMGCTIREYIEQARMKAAARLLIHQPEANIDSIASQVGISAPGNFFRIFRKRFGVTPSVYRAR